MQQCKNKKICQKKFFPTYLPNQKLQGRDTANKQFFKDGLIFFQNVANFYFDNFNMFATDEKPIQNCYCISTVLAHMP